MRHFHAVSAFLMATGCVLASAADARAQSCNNYAAPNYRGGALGGNWQVQFGNNSCTPLTGVRVTVAVSEDIVVASSNGTDNGFSMQLNANGPVGGLPSQQYWQQFLIRADTKNAADPNPGVDAFMQTWAFNNPQEPNIFPNPTFLGLPATANNAFLTIPAGSIFTWQLTNDAYSNVTSCQFSAMDSIGTQYPTVPKIEVMPTTTQTPIYSIQMEIIGYNNASFTTFQSGAGTIYYSGGPFVTPANYDFPSCVSRRAGGTGEDSNMAYGTPTQELDGTWTQTFWASTAGVFRNGDCGYPGNYPSSLGDWAHGDYKDVCPLGAPMYGISRTPGQTWSDTVLCGTAREPAFKNPGTGCYARPVGSFGGFDSRGDTSEGDWDPGSYKTECADTEYVAGVSQSSSNGALTSVLCCPGKVTHQSCEAEFFYSSDSHDYAPPDWDFGHPKGECPVGQYVAGISTPAYSSIGITGAAHAILCCSP
jgi:hypothetical protein